MAEELDALEQRWRGSGADPDEAAWLEGLVAAGALPREQLELAAHCAHPAALLACATEAPELDPAAWCAGLARWGSAALQRAALAAARCALDSHFFLFPTEERPLRAVAESEARLLGQTSFERNMVFQRVLRAAESCARDAAGPEARVLRSVASAAYHAAWAMVPQQDAGDAAREVVVEKRVRRALTAACEAAGAEALGAARAELVRWALGRGDPLTERESSGRIRLVGNAPAGWPALELDARHLAPPSYPHRGLLNNIVFANALQTAGLQLVAGDWECFLPAGVLSVPFVVEQDEQRYDIFWFADASPEDAARWATINALYADLDRPAPIHYARRALPDAEPLEAAAVLTTLEVASMAVDTRLEPGRYAMWWSSPGDTHFAESAARNHLARLYRALDGLGQHVRARLLKAFGAESGAEGRTFPLQGPCFQRLAVRLGPRRGVSFHFPIESTPPAFRDGCLHQLALWAERQAADAAPPLEASARAWWEALEQAEGAAEVVGELPG